jgi:hypothetical protein
MCMYVYLIRSIEYFYKDVIDTSFGDDLEGDFQLMMVAWLPPAQKDNVDQTTDFMSTMRP